MTKSRGIRKYADKPRHSAGPLRPERKPCLGHQGKNRLENCRKCESVFCAACTPLECPVCCYPRRKP